MIKIEDALNLNKHIKNGSTVREIDLQIINDIFKDLLWIKPASVHTWKTEDELKATKQGWLRAFKDAGLTDLNKIAHGLRKLSITEGEFPPSVGTFIAMCEYSSEDLGMPSFEIAYMEACQNSHPWVKDKKWSHESVRQAWVASQSSTFTSQPAEKSRQVFAYHYKIITRKLAANQPMPYQQPLKSIEEPEAPSTKEVAQKHLKAMLDMLKPKKVMIEGV